MKPKEAKKQQNVFKSIVSEISKGKYKLKEQERALQNIIF